MHPKCPNVSFPLVAFIYALEKTLKALLGDHNPHSVPTASHANASEPAQTGHFSVRERGRLFETRVSVLSTGLIDTSDVKSVFDQLPVGIDSGCLLARDVTT